MAPSNAIDCCTVNSTPDSSANITWRPVDSAGTDIAEVVLNTIYVLTNTVIIVAVVQNKRLHTVANVFMSSLAASNLLLAVIVDVHRILVLSSIETHAFSRLTTCAYLYCFAFSMTCSLYNHFMIAAERWLYIARPFLHPRVITYRSTACGVILSWLLALLGGVKLIAGTCTRQYFIDNVHVFYALVLSVFHFILSASMFIIYGHIAVITRNQTKAIHKTAVLKPGNSRSELDQILSSVRSTWRQVRMLVVVFGVYFLLTTPYIALNLYVYIHNKETSIYYTFVGKLVSAISHVQCGANLFTYCLQDRNFRSVLRKWISKTRLDNNCGRVKPLSVVK